MLTFSYNHFTVDAISCYNCEINEEYNLDDCKAFDDDTPEENCPGLNYCISFYGKVNGETDLEFHSCDYEVGFKGISIVYRMIPYLQYFNILVVNFSR